MARKSRKNTVPNDVGANKDRVPMYSAALYGRISVDSERKRESDSIGTQIRLLKDFVSQHGDIEVYDIYADNNISGTDFIRPEFSRMMNDMRSGKVNCVIVKDLSRLGRNMLESGDYIENVFPQHKIRFIAVADAFDTLTDTPDISIQIRNYANELYAKDISQKICSVKRVQAEAGKRTGATAPYGYMTDPNDKGHLVIDPDTAPIVLEIFRLYADGNTMHFIAKTLNEQMIPSPGKYLYMIGLRKTEKFKNSIWFMSTIKRILENPVYIGWIVSGKNPCRFFATGTKESKPAPKEDWLIHKGMHEPIVPAELFDEVQTALDRRTEQFSLVSTIDCPGKRGSIFKGTLRCGECGRAMTLRKKGDRTYYVCPIHDSYGAAYCPKKGVKGEDVESIALACIQNQIRLFTDAKNLIQKLNSSKAIGTKRSIINSQIRNALEKIEKLNHLKASLYEDLTGGIITRDDFQELSNQYGTQMDELRIFVSELEQTAAQYSADYGENTQWNQLIQQYGHVDALDEQTISAFVDKLSLFNDGHVEVVFKYRNEIDSVISTAAIRKTEAAKWEV